MKKQTFKPSKTPLAAAISMLNNFSGLQDWFEVFRSGEQTDSAGNTTDFTDDDLDSIVANHSADDPAPLVVGHPKTNAPAYGWTESLMRVGDTLLARATDVAEEFETAVKAKHFRKRSVSIQPDGNGGYKLRHIGFLGAAAPAVAGLKDIAFADGEGVQEFSFDAGEDKRAIGWSLDSLGSCMRRLRDYLIDQSGLEVADKLIPSWEVDNVASRAAHLIEQANAADGNRFAAPPTITPPNKPPKQGDNLVDPKDKQFTQADIDAAVEVERKKLEALQKTSRDLKFSAVKQRAQEVIDSLVAKGMKPAVVVGLADFCASLSALEENNTFEFSASNDAGAQPISKSLHEFAMEFLGHLQEGNVIQLGKAKIGDEPVNYSDDPKALSKAAREYVSAQQALGINVSVSEAVSHVQAQAAASK